MVFYYIKVIKYGSDKHIRKITARLIKGSTIDLAYMHLKTIWTILGLKLIPIYHASCLPSRSLITFRGSTVPRLSATALKNFPSTEYGWMLTEHTRTSGNTM